MHSLNTNITGESPTYFHTSVPLQLQLVFKTGILFSLKMVHLYQNTLWMILSYSVLRVIKNVHLFDVIKVLFCVGISALCAIICYCIVFETTALICMDCIVLTMMFMLFLSVCSVFYDKFHVQLLQDRLWTYEMRYVYVYMYLLLPKEQLCVGFAPLP